MTLSYTPINNIQLIELPASKSISNRVLLIRALSNTDFRIYNLSEANDTQLLKRLLNQVKEYKQKLSLDTEDAGTPFRFLTAYLAMQEGKEFIISGDKRLQERPIQDLVLALQSIGADILYLNKNGFAPLHIRGRKLTGAKVQIKGDISSQFISALCLIAPTLKDGLEIEIHNQVVSDSYIQMTLDLLHKFDIDFKQEAQHIFISPQSYKTFDIVIENDWSSATFFYAMLMLMKEGELQLSGLMKNSIQGDACVQQIATHFGVLTTFNEDVCILSKHFPTVVQKREFDLSAYPDMAVPLIVACAVKYPQISFTGIDHLELKESKRITSIQNELAKIGIQLVYENNCITFDAAIKENIVKEVNLLTYNDHRLVMAFSMLTLVGYTVTLDNTSCVKKSFPNFFKQIEKIGISERKD